MRQKVFPLLRKVGDLHLEPLGEGINGKLFHTNRVLMALSYLLGRNHLCVGEPGWGKTTGSKILGSVFSGTPYDLIDKLEIRGHPGQYDEKIVGRFDLGKLNAGKEVVIWQGSFLLPLMLIDEVNRLPIEVQETLLQGVDTGVWTYMNRHCDEGKKATFMTMNERHDVALNGMLPAFSDRIDVVTEHGFDNAMDVLDYETLVKARHSDLYNPQGVLAALKELEKDTAAFKAALKGLQRGGLTQGDLEQIRGEIDAVNVQNEFNYLLMMLTAEINYSEQFGRKRAGDGISPEQHDQKFAGVCVGTSFSPRSIMAAMQYGKGLAWLLGEDATIDHMRFVLPHVLAHKAHFNEKFVNAHGADTRRDYRELHLAKVLVGEVYDRYQKDIKGMTNFISAVQALGESGGVPVEYSTPDGKKQLTVQGLLGMSLADFDHPFMKNLVAKAQAAFSGKQAFYEVD